MLESMRRAVRGLHRDPILWLTATLTLALCIGANTTVFSLVNSILLRPLPFPDSDRIYSVNERMGKSQAEVGSGRRLLQPPRGPSRIRRGRRLRPAHPELERPGKARTTGRRPGHAVVLFRAGHQTHDRALSGAGRRRARCAGRRRGQLSVLARTPGRRPARGRSDAGAGRPVAHHRWRDAAGLRLSPRNPDLASPARWMNPGSARAPPCVPCAWCTFWRG